MTIKVVLADDQPLVRGGFRLILEAEDDVEVVGEASDGEEAVAAARRLQPDVVLMDVQMPQRRRPRGHAPHRAERERSAARVLILTTFERDDYVFEALRAGASGFMLKNAPPEELVRAVRIVAAGEALLAPSITRRVIEEYARQLGSPPARRQARPSHRARARSAPAAGHRQEQLRARRPPLPRRGHDQDPRLPRARQARPARPRAGGRVRLRERPRRAGQEIA